MSHEQPGVQPGAERFDADAVCEVCSMVNPPGTLLCKQCGNNLRDQRRNRMADPTADVPDETGASRQILGKLLIVLAAGVLIWTMMNIDRIQDWAVAQYNTADAVSADPAEFWTGDNQVRFDAMFNRLAASSLTQEDLRAALEAAPTSTEMEGRYVLQRVSGFGGSTLGEAYVDIDGGTAYFVARLRGDTEVRGQATIRDDSLQSRTVGVMTGNQIVSAFGLAQRNQESGAYECLALLGDSEVPLNALAYRIPD